MLDLSESYCCCHWSLRYALLPDCCYRVFAGHVMTAICSWLEPPTYIHSKRGEPEDAKMVSMPAQTSVSTPLHHVRTRSTGISQAQKQESVTWAWANAGRFRGARSSAHRCLAVTLESVVYLLIPLLLTVIILPGYMPGSSARAYSCSCLCASQK